jgi:hypothetical protein
MPWKAVIFTENYYIFIIFTKNHLIGCGFAL